MSPPPVEHVNEVLLVGRLSADPQERELPSGDPVVTVRLVVDRLPAQRRAGPRIDVLDCSAWAGGVRRSVLRWRRGDVVEVQGRLRRTFRRGSEGPVTSRWDVEIVAGRRVARAEDAAPAGEPRALSRR